MVNAQWPPGFAAGDTARARAERSRTESHVKLASVPSLRISSALVVRCGYPRSVSISRTTGGSFLPGGAGDRVQMSKHPSTWRAAQLAQMMLNAAERPSISM